jgi:hypothetical protein
LKRGRESEGEDKGGEEAEWEGKIISMVNQEYKDSFGD